MSPNRFTGSSVTSTNYSGYTDPATQQRRYDSGGLLTLEGEFAPDLTLPIFDPVWEFDIETDGQSVTIHKMRVSYSGTVVINPLVSIDLELEATIKDTTVDINPSQTTVWTVQEHLFSELSVSGVYNGLGLTQPFSGALPSRAVTFPFSSPQALLDFANWPNELLWNAQAFPRFVDGVFVDFPGESRSFDSPSSEGWIGLEPFLHVRKVDLFEPISVLLTPFKSQP